ncbi:MAG TPA: response regulator transcription factor [Gemmatimonadaceae bacterium]|nr:response regulator transcription factor [Gemmatimonadaceae bacterium]
MRILLAEDDRQLRASIARGLREASYTVDFADTGPKALALASGAGYDLVVLDILLPGKSGLIVCRTLRERGVRTPILMLTALDAVEKRIAGLDAGADDYLTKPFDFGELLARLRALGRRPGDVVANRIEVGDLVIDASRHTVHRGKREIPITPKEFAFLEHLARHAGHLVTRDDLMKHVWEDTRGSYSNIIDVYASRLRRKLDDGEGVALFQTVRGMGFMLEPPRAPRTSDRQPESRTARRRS